MYPGNFLQKKLGSSDQLITDSLRAGDLVLFKRRWNDYPFPEAVAIKLYQTVYSAQFDHCAVVVQNDYGEPFLLELRDSLTGPGISLMPFETRVKCNYRDHIVILPISYGEDRIKIIRELLWQAAQSASQDHGCLEDAPWKSSHLYTLLFKGIFSYYIGFDSSVPYCPSTSFIVTFISRICDNSLSDNNLDILSKSRSCTCQQLLDNRSEVSASLKKSNIIFGEHFIVRTD